MATRERREARAGRLREWAEKRQHAAAAVFKQGEHYRGDFAFNTQPGHIPERARLIAREDRAFESLNKADEMTSRAAGIERQLDGAIYSDDDNAIDQLRERIADLEATRDRFKAANAVYRKANGPALKALTVYGRDQALPHPGWEITNLTGNIARNKKRITDLEWREKQQAAAEDNGGVLVKAGPGWVQLTFTDYPGRPMVAALKDGGMYYSGGSWNGSRSKFPADCPANVDAATWENIRRQIVAQGDTT